MSNQVDPAPNMHSWLNAGLQGRELLPPATPDLLGKTHDVEFVHPHYGLIRATYICYRYKHYKSSFHSWGIERAVQLDEQAPRPPERGTTDWRGKPQKP